MNFLEHFTIDHTGNLYYDDMLITIDNSNNINFYKVNIKSDIKKISSEIKKENLQIINDIEKELEQLKERTNNEDNDFDDNEIFKLQEYLYNPELKYIIQEDNYESDEEQQPYIKINGNFNLIESYFDLANYEVFILDSNKNLLSYTQLINDNPIYRIIIYEDNKIELNIIGTKNILYKFDNTDNIINNNILDSIICVTYQNL
jgi:hypothetical protein